VNNQPILDTTRKLVLASGNVGKLAELESLLAPLGFSLVSQNALGIMDPPENASTFIENALIKARNASTISGLPALADDSGLCVDALAGAPGLISAHYAGRHGDVAGNIAKLLYELRDCDQRSARFVSVLVLLRYANDPQPLIAQGEWHGEILRAPQGVGGFGYDPIFFDPRLGKSAAELDAPAKNKCSHRGRALAELLRQLV
jgi:XTP/dITP diphosphohydrolase